jgi:hypothetical protein
MMPKLSRTIATLALLAVIFAMLGPAALSAQPAMQEPAAVNTAADTEDDEVILVLSNGYIKVEDPHTDVGDEPATWTSPEAGWTAVSTADFNGDGVDEIIALGGSKLKIYAPFAPPGALTVLFQMNVSPQTWFKAIGGDVDGDGRAELVALQNDTVDPIYAHLYVFDGNAAGSSWTKIVDLSFGTQWADMALGDYLGDGTQKLVLSREIPEGGQMLLMNAQTGASIAQAYYGTHWFRVVAGDFNEDGRDELAALRDVIASQGADNLVIFRVSTGGFTKLYGMPAGQIFQYEAAGDLDNDGAAELAMVRNIQAPYKGLYGVDLVSPIITLNEVIGEGWLDIQTGDLDGDGYSKVIILKDSLVRAYAIVVPAPAITWQKSGTYYGAFATGNVDGHGIVKGPSIGVAPTTLNFSMVSRGSSPAPQTVTVSNTTTTDVIHWTVTESPATDWLYVSAASGNTPGSFQVLVDGAVAPPGVSQARLIVAGGSGTINGPITVTVNLNVTAPTLVVSPTRLPDKRGRAGQSVPAETLRVRQADGGSGSIDWTAAVIYKDAWQNLLARGDSVKNVRLSAAGLDAEVDGQPVHLNAVAWLALSPEQGSTPRDVVVTYDSTGLAEGKHEATIVVDAGSGVINRLGYCDAALTITSVNALPLIARGW